MRSYYTSDPVADADNYYSDMEEDAKRFPVCSVCGEPIFDDTLWEIDGEIYCTDCAIEEFCRKTEDYMEGE